MVSQSVRLGVKPHLGTQFNKFTADPRQLLSKQSVAYCWHLPAWLFLVLSPIGTHDHIFVLIYNPYGIRQWASPSVRGGVGLFNAAGICQLLYLELPLICLLHFKEAEALPPRHSSSPWGGKLCQSHFTTDDQ
jgi:hypothetical protein